MKAVRVKIRENTPEDPLKERELIFEHAPRERILAQVIDIFSVTHGNPARPEVVGESLIIRFENSKAIVTITGVEYFNAAEALVGSMLSGSEPSDRSLSLVDQLKEEEGWL